MSHDTLQCKKKRVILRITIICAIVIVLIVTAFFTWSKYSDQIIDFIDQPVINTSPYTTSYGQNAQRYTEKTRRYEILVEYPQEDQVDINNAIKSFVGANESGFLEQVTGPKKQAQIKGVKPNLKIEFMRYQVGDYTSMYLTAQHISGGKKTNKSVSYLYKKGDNKLLKATDLFRDNSNYHNRLIQQMAEELNKEKSNDKKIDIDAIKTKALESESFFDNNLVLTDKGLCVALEGQLINGDNLLLNGGYKTFASCLKITLPDGLVPQPQLSYDINRVINFKKDKVVALTFDDGPNPLTTPIILDILKQYNARATFFVVGYNSLKFPKLLKRMVEQHSEIGDHTQRHANLTKMTLLEAQSDVTSLIDTVEDATGTSPVLLRPPGGHISDELAAAIDMPVIMWDVDPQDWKDKNAQRVAQHIISHIKNGDIVLMHDIYKSSADALPVVLNELSAQGYEFVTVSELLNGRGEFAGKLVRNRQIHEGDKDSN